MRREPVAVLTAAAAGGVLLLVVEPAVGLVALAGTGAALLLQPRPRRATAAVLTLVGVVTTAVGAASGEWPLAAGGLLVGGAAGLAAVRSARWPALRSGARDRVTGPAGRETPGDTWAALDRGEDPTT